jgi:uncharacterized protein (DUF58 family)
MLPYERVVRRYSVQCRWRGLFDFGPGRVESGDLLGYNQRSENYRRVDRLIVYPKLLELDIPTPVSRRIIGRQAIDRVILTDPSRTTGVRPYRPGDPLRHVEWRASARSRDLLVRTFEPTTDLSLAIFVNFRAPGQDLRHNDPMELELVVSLAASLARWTLKRGYPVGVYGNGTRGRMQAVRIPVGSHPDHLLHILEALAVATPYTSTSISQIMLAEMRGLPFESSLVLVTAALDAELLAAAAEARRRRPLTIICLEQSDGTPAAMAGSVPHLITVPYDERWPERDALRLGT